jgi:hypothetical protein
MPGPPCPQIQFQSPTKIAIGLFEMKAAHSFAVFVGTNTAIGRVLLTFEHEYPPSNATPVKLFASTLYPVEASNA